MPRRSDVGRLVEDVALGHRAGVVEVERVDELAEYCRARGLGMARRAIRAALTQPEPGSLRVDRLCG